MPELPELETIKRDFNKDVRGRIFKSVEIRDSKVAQFSQKEFNEKIARRKIKQADRFAKILIIETEGEFGLMIHLKMSGQLIYEASSGRKSGGGHPDKAYKGKKLPHKYTHIIFHLLDGSKLYFNNLRKFGWIKIVNTSDIKKLDEIAKLGPEPLSEKFSLEYFRNNVKGRRSRSTIKNLIMDQKFISGIGNIYANEALFEAGIDPRRKAGDLSDEEIKKLYIFIKEILKKAIELRGTSDDLYVDLKGKQGGYLNEALVYNKEGKPCPKCKGRIKKIKVGNRGTYYCPNCQT